MRSIVIAHDDKWYASIHLRCDDADYLSAAALGDDAVVLLAVDDAPVIRRISPSS